MFENGVKSKSNFGTAILQNLFKAIEPLENVRSFSFVIIAWQLTLLTMMLIRENILTLTFIQNIWNLISGDSALRQLAFWSLIAISTLTAAALLLPACLRSHLATKGKVLSFFCAFLHFNCILCTLCSISFIKTSKLLPIVGLYITTLPVQLLLLYVQPHLHLFGVASFLVLMSEALFPIQIWRFLFLAVIMYNCKEGGTSLQKNCSMILFIIGIWSICFTNVSNQNILELLYLAIPAIGIGIAAGTLEFRVPSENIAEIMLAMASRVDGLNDEITLRMKDKILLLGCVQTAERDLNCSNRVEQFEKDILANKIKKKDLLFLLEATAITKNLNHLQAEIEIIRKNKGIKLFKLISRIQVHTLNDFFQLSKLKAKAEGLYRADATVRIDGRFVEQINHEVEVFYEHVYSGLQSLVLLWNDASAPKINIPNINKSIQKVTDCHQKAQKCLRRLRAYYPGKIEEKILKEFQQLYNHYTYGFGEAENQQVVEEEENYDYIVLLNDKVEKASARLIAGLNISQQAKYSSSEMPVIPNEILRRVTDNMEEYLQGEFFLPVLAGSSILVKSARICLIPTYEQHLKYLIILKNASADYSFIYDRGNNQIVFFSSKMQELLRKLDHPAELGSIPHEILNIDIADAVEELKKHRKLSLDTIGSRKADLNQNHRSDLTLLTTFGKPDRELILLELKKNKQNRSRTRRGKLQSEQSVQVDSTTAKRFAAYKQEKHFCKIKNTYGNVIVQKLKNFDRVDSISNPCWVGILLSTLLILLVVTLVMLVAFSGQRHSEYTRLIDQGSLLSIEYNNIVTLFYESHIRLFIKRYPQEVVDWNPKLNTTEMIAYYTSSLSTLIGSILAEQIDNQFQLDKKQLNYTINYKLLNFSGSTHHPDIVFLLQQAKRSLINFNITFLIDNYRSIRQFEQAYELGSIVTPQIKDQHHREFVLIAATFSLCCCLLITMGVIILVTEKTVFKSIYSYLQKVTFKQYSNSLTKTLKYLQRQSILNHCDNLHEYACSKRIQISIEQLRAQSSLENRQVEEESTFNVMLRSHMLLLLLIALVIAGFLYKSDVEYELSDFIAIIDCLQTLQSNALQITSQMTDIFSAAGQRDFYGSATLYGLSNIVNLTSQVSMHDLPTFFDDFKQQYRTTLLGNLCLLSSIIQNITFISSMNCEDIYDGALLKGYSVASESYRASLVNIRNVSGAQFLRIYRPNGVYPISVQGFYYKEIVARLITNKIEVLRKLTAEFSINKKTQTNHFLAAIFLGLGLICCFTIRNIFDFKKRCKIAFCVLRSIPRSTLLSIKYSKQMIREKFLASLERL